MQSTPTNENNLDLYSDKINSDKYLKTFPNPVTYHQLTISNENIENKGLMVELIDINGSTIYSILHTFNGGKTNIQYNIQTNGVYFIRIID